MTLLRRLSRSTAFRTIVVVLVLALAWQVYLTVRAPGRIAPELAVAVEEGQPLRVSVALDFPPERFHSLKLQSYGHVMGVEDNRIHLRSVRPESVAALAKIYWVDRLELYEDDAG
ncbi:hypothetical protein [Blastococcus saxobsidens]|uniref:Uncharacterized protein n=1 Tax=Blastococcus saxobsidens TaxID=138336 RepID=A0A4Q7Y863_9ACTN|nr:hypothetical protein [Blastococcus saxobsidens]RZU32209.1 hypothetical protein BKA19_1904 [Blastococcus saxobsidens]